MVPTDIRSPLRSLSLIHFSFLALGLLNNFTFVIFVTAAEDLIANHAGIILLAVVIPGFISRLILSSFIHKIPYTPRILLVSLVSSGTTLFVALVPITSLRITALIIQAAIGAFGEMSFLALTSMFPDSVVGMYASGTGVAGLVAAGSYAGLTNILGISVKNTLIGMSIVPMGLIIVYRWGLHGNEGYTNLNEQQEIPEDDRLESVTQPEAEKEIVQDSNESISPTEYFPKLLLTYMMPLSVVYFSEYVINQGVMGTMTVFRDGRAHDMEKTYRGLQFMYQAAVFVSRSSIYVFKVHALWVLPVLQTLNLVVLLLSSMFVWLPNLFSAYAIVAWEGLLGGLTYVNAFYRLRREAPEHLREWAIGTATVGDAAGISLAAIVSTWLEPAILQFRGDKS